MSKKTLILSALFLMVMLGSGCGKKPSDTQPTASNNTPDTTVPATVAPKDCGSDKTCGNSLLAECLPGNLSISDSGMTSYMVVKGKTGDACLVENYSKTTDLGEFGAKYDVNIDGKIGMECALPSTVKNLDDLTSYVNTPAGLDKCSGELRTLGDEMNKAQ